MEVQDHLLAKRCLQIGDAKVTTYGIVLHEPFYRVLGFEFDCIEDARNFLPVLSAYFNRDVVADVVPWYQMPKQEFDA